MAQSDTAAEPDRARAQMPHRRVSKPASAVASALASTSRALPPVRGKYHVVKRINAAVLALGADPLVATTMRAGHRMRIDLRSRTEFYAYWSGAYDDGFIRLLSTLIAPDALVLDVGGHVGFYTVPLAIAAQRRGSEVYVYEPVPQNLARLRENLILNRLVDVVTCVPVALSDREGAALITLWEDHAMGSTAGNAALTDASDQYPTMGVETRSLDSMMHQFSRPVGLIKVDIEGHEDRFLRGARRVLELFRPVIFMEVNKPFLRQRANSMKGVFTGLFPSQYRYLRPLDRDGGRWRHFAEFDECAELDNVLICPDERASSLERQLVVLG